MLLTKVKRGREDRFSSKWWPDLWRQILVSSETNIHINILCLQFHVEQQQQKIHSIWICWCIHKLEIAVAKSCPYYGVVLFLMDINVKSTSTLIFSNRMMYKNVEFEKIIDFIFSISVNWTMAPWRTTWWSMEAVSPFYPEPRRVFW